MSLEDDRNWAAKIYEERAEAVDADQNVTYFFLKDCQEICRYMRTIGYGSKGKAESVEKQVARELEIGRYWSRYRDRDKFLELLSGSATCCCSESSLLG